MKIHYKIEQIPHERDNCEITAYTEGLLSIHLAGEEFLSADGILLVEFAIVLSRWLIGLPRQKGMFYASMDFDDEPIVQFHSSSNGLIYIDSVWAEESANDPVSLELVVSAVEGYISSLKNALSEHGISLEAVIQAALADEP